MKALDIIREKLKKYGDRQTLAVALIFLAGFALRLAYVLNTGWNVRQHDVGGDEGHLGYMLYLMLGGRPVEEFREVGFFKVFLPDFDPTGHWQFYHPPLWHLLGAFWMKIQMYLGATFETARENLQLLSLVCSTAIMFISYKIFRLFDLKNGTVVFACAFVALHPTFIFLSGSINNDVLSLTLMLLSLYLTLKWYREPSFKRIIGVALAVGAAMMTKLSAGTVAFAIAFLFLVAFIKTKKKGVMIGQFAVFGAICVPTALWWQFRNFIRFGTSITYVPRLSDTNSQYIGFRSVAERLFDFSSLSDYGVYPVRAYKTYAAKYGYEYYEYNIPLGAMKSSVFGEYYVGADEPLTRFLAVVLFALAAVACMLATAAAVWMLVRVIKAFARKDTASFREKQGFDVYEYLFILVFTLTQLVSYVKFCFDYPHFCTMDFRYIALTAVVGALMLGLLSKLAPGGRARGRAGNADESEKNA